jgi:hypothetical protein
MHDKWWKTLSLCNEADNLCEGLLTKINDLARTSVPGNQAAQDKQALHLYRLLQRAYWRKNRREMNHSLVTYIG